MTIARDEGRGWCPEQSTVGASGVTVALVLNPGHRCVPFVMIHQLLQYVYIVRQGIVTIDTLFSIFSVH